VIAIEDGSRVSRLQPGEGMPKEDAHQLLLEIDRIKGFPAVLLGGNPWRAPVSI